MTWLFTKSSRSYRNQSWLFSPGNRAKSSKKSRIHLGIGDVGLHYGEITWLLRHRPIHGGIPQGIPSQLGDRKKTWPLFFSFIERMIHHNNRSIISHMTLSAVVNWDPSSRVRNDDVSRYILQLVLKMSKISHWRITDYNVKSPWNRSYGHFSESLPHFPDFIERQKYKRIGEVLNVSSFIPVPYIFIYPRINLEVFNIIILPLYKIRIHLHSGQSFWYTGMNLVFERGMRSIAITSRLQTGLHSSM